MEEDEVEGSDGYAAVREIEDRLEEAERMASDEREPGRPGGIDQREVEHVHDLAEHHRGIAAAEFGHGRPCGLGEKLSVRQTVDDVAQGPGRDYGQADEDSCRHFYILLLPVAVFPGAVSSADKTGNPPAEEAE